MGQGQDAALDAELSAWNKRTFVQDLQGIPRVVQAQRP
jgi:hypothetical protein